MGLKHGEGILRRCPLALLLGLAVLAVAALGTSVAKASTLEGINSLEVKAGQGEQNQVTVTQSGLNFVVTDTAGITDNSHQLLSCTQDTPNQITCPQVPFINVWVGNLDDSVHLVDLPPVSVQLYGGPGNDLLDASGVEYRDGPADVLEGDPGNDTLIGTPGGSFFDSTCQPDVPCDRPQSDHGDDRMTGGRGGDVMYGGVGRDVMDAGAGADTLRAIVEKPIAGLPGGFPADDRAVDTADCGGGHDLAYLGVDDKVSLECEDIQQFAVCKSGLPGSTCEGEPKVTAAVASDTGGKLSAESPALGASAAASKRKPRQVVLATAGKVVLQVGSRGSVTFTLKKKKVKRTLGKRAAMKATFRLSLDRIRRGKKVGRTKRDVPFRLRRQKPG